MRLQKHPTDCYGRTVISATTDRLETLPADLAEIDHHFVLVIAADSSTQSAADLLSSAEALIRRGASYVCCWGPDCGRRHDCFDEADLALNGESTDKHLIITTWHDDAPLEEVLWFALNAAVPSPAYEAVTRSVVAAVVARSDWAERIRAYLDAGAPLRDEA